MPHNSDRLCAVSRDCLLDSCQHACRRAEKSSQSLFQPKTAGVLSMGLFEAAVNFDSRADTWEETGIEPSKDDVGVGEDGQPDRHWSEESGR